MSGSNRCASGAALVTILSGEQLLPQALCLRLQLRAVGSVCPMLLVHDDREHVRLRAESVIQLQEALGRDHVMASSWLFAQAQQQRHWREHVAPVAAHHRNRRRLFRSYSDFLSGTFMIKLHLFAMPTRLYNRLLFLDLDTLIVRNLDPLLVASFNEPIAAVPLPRLYCPSSTAKSPWFNSGFLLLKPSLEHLNGLLLRTCWYFSKTGASRAHMVRMKMFGGLNITSREICLREFSLRRPAHANTADGGERATRVGHEVTVAKVCESHLAVQSLLNYHFRRQYFQLPSDYNVQVLLRSFFTIGGFPRPPPARSSRTRTNGTNVIENAEQHGRGDAEKAVVSNLTRANSLPSSAAVVHLAGEVKYCWKRDLHCQCIFNVPLFS